MKIARETTAVLKKYVTVKLHEAHFKQNLVLAKGEFNFI